MEGERRSKSRGKSRGSRSVSNPRVGMGSSMGALYQRLVIPTPFNWSNK